MSDDIEKILQKVADKAVQLRNLYRLPGQYVPDFSEATQQIQALLLEARLKEVKLCQGKKAISKDAYLENRQSQLEWDLDVIWGKDPNNPKLVITYDPNLNPSGKESS